MTRVGRQAGSRALLFPAGSVCVLWCCVCFTRLTCYSSRGSNGDGLAIHLCLELGTKYGNCWQTCQGTTVIVHDAVSGFTTAFYVTSQAHPISLMRPPHTPRGPRQWRLICHRTEVTTKKTIQPFRSFSVRCRSFIDSRASGCSPAHLLILPRDVGPVRDLIPWRRAVVVSSSPLVLFRGAHMHSVHQVICLGRFLMCSFTCTPPSRILSSANAEVFPGSGTGYMRKLPTPTVLMRTDTE